MRNLALLVLLACFGLGMTGCGGCGGGLSEASMRARSRKRTPEEKEDAPPASVEISPAAQPAPATTPPPQATTSQPPATAATAAASPVPADAATAAPVAAAAVATIAPAPPRHVPGVEHLAAPVPQEPLPEIGKVTVVVPPAAPGEQLSPLDQRARAIDNLRRIGSALHAYVAKFGALPPQAIQNENGERTLSWRVAILPQLGHDALYRQFRLHEPWDSPHNRQLVAQIPPEFQSPLRRDDTTNVLALVGPDSAFGGVRGPVPSSFEDGPENTILIVEGSDDRAVTWTMPQDLEILPGTPRAGLATHREDGALAVMGDGRVLRVPPELPDFLLAALYTTDRAEPVVAANVLAQPTLEVAAVAATRVDPLEELMPSGSAAAEGPVSPANLLSNSKTPARPGLLPVPDEASLAASRELLKDLYQKQVEEARKPEEWAKIIPMLLGEAPKVEANPSDYYELLRIVRDMAAAGGDAASALKAIELLEQKFQIDPVAMRLKLLDDTLKAARSANAPATLATTLSQTARDLLFAALDRDDYESAQKAYQHLLDYTKLKGDRQEIQRVTQGRAALDTAQRAFAPVPEAIKKLEQDHNDADANEVVGRYLCLVKGRWNDGLPLLLRGANVDLRVVATIDLESSRTPQQTVALADKYWEMAAAYKQPLTRNLQLRAAYCYQLAAAQLSGGLEKVKAQKRLDEVNQMYGAAEVAKALQRMNPESGVPVAVVPDE